MNDFPNGSQAEIKGLHYKVGRHGLVYYWNGEDWMRSSLSPDEVKSEAKREIVQIARGL